MVRFVLNLAAGLLLFSSVWAGIDHFASREARQRRFRSFWLEHGRAVNRIEREFDVRAMHFDSHTGWHLSRAIPFSLSGGTSEARHRAAEELTALDSRIVISLWE